ncbi:hypothetical protein IJG89_01120 [Candidatus Saccharibacteria bacterium]|nr:hypothetical protein [Candidatus Saccharibacteria bacterium]
MTNKKCELTNEKITFMGRVLHRIRALRNFGIVKVGDLGGFIESEDNLSQDGSCWVFDYAKVYGNARVYGNAMVFDYAKVFYCAEVFDCAMVFSCHEKRPSGRFPAVTRPPLGHIVLF